jgi:hypothetical protein
MKLFKHHKDFRHLETTVVHELTVVRGRIVRRRTVRGRTVLGRTVHGAKTLHRKTVQENVDDDI